MIHKQLDDIVYTGSSVTLGKTFGCISYSIDPTLIVCRHETTLNFSPKVQENGIYCVYVVLYACQFILCSIVV